MKKAALSVIVLIILFALFNSCSDPASPGKDLTQIDSKILINLREELLPQGRNLILDCSTEKIYPCCNYTIQNSIVKGQNFIKIEFTGISIPEICATALGPAYCPVYLGQLADGNYSLSLEVNGQLIPAQLTVSNKAYGIYCQQNSRFEFKKSDLLRVPDSLIWGSIEYIHDSLSTAANSFLDSLRIYGAQTVQLEPGDYGYFKVDAQGSLTLPGSSGRPFTKVFAYKFDNTLGEIQSLLFRYYELYQDNLLIMVFDWRGAVIFNWGIIIDDKQG